MWKLVVILVLATVVASCTFQGPTDPSEAPLSLNPQVIHMRVGDSQIFTAEGGDGVNYRFGFRHNEVYYFFNFEHIVPNKIKLTLVKDFSSLYIYLNIGVESGTQEVFSRIYFSK